LGLTCVAALCVVLGDSVSTVEFYDPVIGRWQLTEPMSTLRSRVGISALGGQCQPRSICLAIALFSTSSGKSDCRVWLVITCQRFWHSALLYYILT